MTDSTISPTRSAEPRRLPPAHAHELIAAGRAVLADVRDSALYENSHPQGARSLPFATVEAARGRLPTGFVVPDDALLILYCA
jgi:rhodanese-related sulfurtransferase